MMFRYIAPAVLAGMLAWSAAAPAQELPVVELTGTIQDIDTVDSVIWLDGGRFFQIPRPWLEGLEIGNLIVLAYVEDTEVTVTGIRLADAQ